MPELVDNRFPLPGTDNRFSVAGQDARFPSPGQDVFFDMAGNDFRFMGTGFGGVTLTTPPDVTGTPAPAQVLTLTDGVWSGAVAYRYRWVRSDTGVIAGAAANTYTLPSEPLAEYTIRGEVQAQAANGFWTNWTASNELSHTSAATFSVDPVLVEATFTLNPVDWEAVGGSEMISVTKIGQVPPLLGVAGAEKVTIKLG